ncbi:MAG: class I SAM-dependent methyltransferase [Synergistaceae bacterium]|nr:class I SAM-dependent methyltransferase [Synergistaceae bacterium]
MFEPLPLSNEQRATSNEPIIYENFERERLTPIYDIIDPYSEMKKNERYFLNGIIRALKPRKILEVGVSSGGGSAIILNAISDIEGAKLYSVDYLEKAYGYPEKLSGFLVNEKFSELANNDKWQIFRGRDISYFIEEIGGDIDLLVLDTEHFHPCEMLNFLCVLPFMKRDSWCVLHDINICGVILNHAFRNALATRYLFGHVVSDEKILPVSDYDQGRPANIGAFKISDVTMKYADNLFQSLFIPWKHEPLIRDINDMRNIIKKYYSVENYQRFCEALKFHDFLFEHPVYEPVPIARAFLRRYAPNFYGWLHRKKIERKNKLSS